MKSLLVFFALVAFVCGEQVKVANLPLNNEDFKVNVVETQYFSGERVKIADVPVLDDKSEVKVVDSSIIESNDTPVSEDNPVHGYLTKVAVPRAEKIRLAEKLYQVKNSRVAGGLPASSTEEFPYHVGILSDIIGIPGNGVCGGVLVSDDRVLTAAHCWNDGVNQAWRLTLVFGSVLLFSGGQRVTTSVVAMHPEWSSTLVRNDIGVVYLPNPIAMNSAIQPIALPYKLDEEYTGAAAIVTGYGVTSAGGTLTNAQSLHYVPLAVISNTVCFLSYPLYITSAHMCTSGSVGFGPCSGDSGGPLAVPYGGTNVLAGIVSFGSADGCASGAPTAYTRITSHMGFITQHL